MIHSLLFRSLASAFAHSTLGRSDELVHATRPWWGRPLTIRWTAARR